MFAALSAALVAALLSLGGASLVIADQPQGKGADAAINNGNGNAYGHTDESPAQNAPTVAPAPASQDGGKAAHDEKKSSSPAKSKHESSSKAQAPVTTRAPAPQSENGGGSHSTATSGPGNSSQGCDGSHNSDTGNGANHSGPYDNTCDGSASGNGNGGGKATGQPCAGCVGNADDKNPKGQYPGGSDHNAGYECDRNHGIGQANPAHTGCQSTDTGAIPAEQSPAGDQGQKCPGSDELSSALSQAAVVALKAAAAAHPEISKLAELAAGKVAANCGNHENQSGNGNGHTPITICHATGSATNPYVEITIDENGLNGHGDHQDDRDIIPAPAEGCPTSSESLTPPTGNDVTPTKDSVTPTVETLTPPAADTVLGTTENGQAPAPAETPGEQAVLGERVGGTSTPAATTSPSGSNEVLGETASGGSAPAAATAPAAANRAVAASERSGTLPFTGTDALLVLFLGCLMVLAGVTLQRVLARD